MCLLKLMQEGITVNKESSGAIIGEDIQCKEGQCTSSGTMRRRNSRIAKETHNLPSVHEDYYGPRLHRPEHH